MGQTTLRRYLQENRESQFIFRNRVVNAQHLADHYSAYLDAQVTTEGPWVFFVTSRTAEVAPFACRVPLHRELITGTQAA